MLLELEGVGGGGVRHIPKAHLFLLHALAHYHPVDIQDEDKQQQQEIDPLEAILTPPAVTHWLLLHQSSRHALEHNIQAATHRDTLPHIPFTQRLIHIWTHTANTYLPHTEHKLRIAYSRIALYALIGLNNDEAIHHILNSNYQFNTELANTIASLYTLQQQSLIHSLAVPLATLTIQSTAFREYALQTARNNPTFAMVFAGALARQQRQLPKDELKENHGQIRAFLLSQFTNTLINVDSKAPLTNESCRIWLSPIAALFQELEFTEKCVPLLSKSLLRSTQDSVLCLSSITTHLSFDIANISNSWIEIAVRELLSKDEVRTSAARELLIAIVRKTNHSASVVSSLILQELHSKEGKPRREALFSSLHQIFSKLPADCLAASAAEVLSSVCTLLNSDSASLIGSYLDRSVEVISLFGSNCSEVPEDLVAFALGRVKTGTVVPFLVMLNQIAERGKIKQLPPGSASVLSSLIKNAQASPHQQLIRAGGILAITLVAYVETSEKATKLWTSSFFDCEGFMTNTVFLDRCEDSELIILCSFCKYVCTHLKEKGDAKSNDVEYSVIARVLITCATYYTKPKIRSIALETIKDIIQSGLLPNICMLQALLARVQVLESSQINPLESPCPTLLQSLLLIITPAFPESDFNSFLFSAILAHHPFVLFSDRRFRWFSVWKKLLSKWSYPMDAISSVCSEHSETFEKTILSPAFLFAPNFSVHLATIRTLSSLLKFPGFESETLLRLSSHFSSSLLNSSLFSLSEYEVKVFLGEDGVLVESHDLTEEKQFESRKKDKKKTDDNADEALIKKPSKNVAKKPAPKTQPGKQLRSRKASEDTNSSELQLLNQQKELREKIKASFFEISAILRCISTLSRLNHVFARNFLIPEFFSLCSKFSQVRIVDEAYGDYLLATASSLEGKVKNRSMIALCLSTLLRRSQNLYQPQYFEELPDWTQSCLSKIVHGLNEGTPSDRGFHPSCLRVFLPLLHCVIFSHDSIVVNEQKDEMSLSEVSFTVLRKHCNINPYSPFDRSVFPVTEISSTLLQITDKILKYRTEAKHCLLQISSLFTSSNVTHLFGNMGLLSRNQFCRETALSILDESGVLYLPQTDDNLARIFLVYNDSEDHKLCDSAVELWDKYSFFLNEENASLVLRYLLSDEIRLRDSAGYASGTICKMYPELQDLCVSTVIKFHEKNVDIAVIDNFGRQTQSQKKGHIRESLAVAMETMVQHLSTSKSIMIFDFLLVQGLEDSDETAWNAALQTLLVVCSYHCTETSANLFLSKSVQRLDGAKLLKNQDTFDKVKEGVAILMGSIAQNLPTGDKQIVSVMSSLLEVVRTPSHSVQYAAADCMSPLMRKIIDKKFVETSMSKMLDLVINGQTYGDRRGASFALAGMIRGLRLSSLNRYKVLEALAAAAQSKIPSSREGALMTYEALFSFLGSKFEPFALKLLPDLLKCYGDSDVSVRQAAQETSRTLMAHLTVHGVKLVLPELLKSLEQSAWRSRVESINLLGSMSFCAPEQLSSSLPVVVPRLMDVLKDPHPKVHSATQQALRDIGSVVRNPEIGTLVPVILDALYDPSKHTQTALQALMEVSFVNYVDSAALALVAPILERALRERVGATKRMAAQIIGSICTLLRSSADIIPYLNAFVSELKVLLMDPSPDVRAACSKALGQLFGSVGESHLSGLIEWLIDLLKKETSNVERVGAAQGLSELLAALDLDAMTRHFHTILDLAKHESAHFRENFLTVVMFMPRALGNDFNIFLDDCIPVVIFNCADPKENVRFAALQAGKSIVDVLAVQYPNDLLDLLEDHLINSNWRIRESTVILTGDLLHKIVGGHISIIQGEQIEFEEDDARKPSFESLIESALGTVRRNKLFSKLFLLQCDVASSIQNYAWHVWKSLVYNGTRMINLMMTSYVEESIFWLSCLNIDRQNAAAKSIADLVHKSGDLLMPVVIPIYQEGLHTEESEARTGICKGLSQLISFSGRNTFQSFADELTKLVLQALCDRSEDVRKAASLSFDALYRMSGKSAVRTVLPPLIEKLAIEDSDHKYIFSSIKEILKVRGGPILEQLIPALTQPPISLKQAKTLASLASVAGNDVGNFLEHILKSLFIAAEGVDMNVADEMNDSDSLVNSIVELWLTLSKANFPHLAETVTKYIDSTKSVPGMVIMSQALGLFLSKGVLLDHMDYFESFMTTLTLLFVHENEHVHSAGSLAVDRIFASVPLDLLCEHQTTITSCVSALSFDRFYNKHRQFIPAFCLKGGIQPFLTVYLHNLMYGTPDSRGEAAKGIQDLVDLSTSDSIKPYVIKITGPLIRIVGDRFNEVVKAAILDALRSLLVKAAPSLKPFVPQLQTTFVKALQDPSRNVRDSAAMGLGSLMLLNVKKANSLLEDLSSSGMASEDPELIGSHLKACGEILKSLGTSSSPEPGLLHTLETIAKGKSSGDNAFVQQQCSFLLNTLQNLK